MLLHFRKIFRRVIGIGVFSLPVQLHGLLVCLSGRYDTGENSQYSIFNLLVVQIPADAEPILVSCPVLEIELFGIIFRCQAVAAQNADPLAALTLLVC